MSSTSIELMDMLPVQTLFLNAVNLEKDDTDTKVDRNAILRKKEGLHLDMVIAILKC